MTARPFRRSIVKVAAAAALAAGLVVAAPVTAGAGLVYDVSVTKTDSAVSVNAGDDVTYTVTVSNAGPSVAIVTLTDDLPSSLTDVTWTCTGAGGGTCTAAGSGDISQSVTLPAGGSVTFLVEATLSISATGQLVNTASTPTVNDSNDGNNAATDTDTIIAAPLGSVPTDPGTPNEAAAAAALAAAPRTTG